jgi:hypothetical protein
MAAAIAPRFFEKHGTVQTPHFLIVHARFEGPCRDTKGLATELKHFRHEGKVIKGALIVEGCQDLGFGEYLDQVTRQQPIRQRVC